MKKNTQRKSRSPEGLVRFEGRQWDPEDLWMDQEVAPEVLVEIDPLDVTREMVKLAEQPELADPVWMVVPRK